VIFAPDPALAVLHAGNEAPGAFRVTSPYRVLRVTVTA
jgi:hypothetical protein